MSDQLAGGEKAAAQAVVQQALPTMLMELSADGGGHPGFQQVFKLRQTISRMRLPAEVPSMICLSSEASVWLQVMVNIKLQSPSQIDQL